MINSDHSANSIIVINIPLNLSFLSSLFSQVIPSANDFQGKYHCPPHSATPSHPSTGFPRRPPGAPARSWRGPTRRCKTCGGLGTPWMKSIGKPCFFIFYKSISWISYMGHLYISIYLYIPYSIFVYNYVDYDGLLLGPEWPFII